MTLKDPKVMFQMLLVTNAVERRTEAKIKVKIDENVAIDTRTSKYNANYKLKLRININFHSGIASVGIMFVKKMEVSKFALKKNRLMVRNLCDSFGHVNLFNLFI